MKNLTVDEPPRTRQLSPMHRDTARIGLESALTAAVSLAQLLGDADVCDRLVAIKRDVLRRHGPIDHPDDQRHSLSITRGPDGE